MSGERSNHLGECLICNRNHSQILSSRRADFHHHRALPMEIEERMNVNPVKQSMFALGDLQVVEYFVRLNWNCLDTDCQCATATNASTSSAIQARFLFHF